MANIVIRKDGGQTAPIGEWEPFRLMRDLLRSDPFSEMLPMLLPEERGAIFAPAFEVKETPTAYAFKADLPGIKEADLEVKMTGNRLVVGGKREAEKEEKGETYFVYERNYGAFTRAFTLPEGVDAEHIAASLDNGVLTLVVPKKPEVQPKKIAVKMGGEKH